MSNNTICAARSNECLYKRLEIAEKATAGPYTVLECENGTIEVRSSADLDETPVCCVWENKDAEFFLYNSPREVKEDIQEIIRLREENSRLELENCKLSIDGVNDEAYLLTCLDIIRKAVGLPVGTDWQRVAYYVELMANDLKFLGKRK